MCNNIFEIKDNFYYNGEPVKIISGGVHYFRIVPEYWRDRLEKLKLLGCNTVETYVPWNLHEPKKGEFCFEGMLDLKRFIELAGELGLWVIVRPSPYICAEWEFGGLPAWLLAEDGMRLRGCYLPFLMHVSDYYEELFKILVPLQITNGGPVIIMQVENEYGYYGDDTQYMIEIKKLMQENGTTVPLVTSDGPWGDALACGSVEGALPTANFGSKAEEQFRVLEHYSDGGPLMIMEFWVGWFDNWGVEKHQTTDVQTCSLDFEDALKLGHVNIYMFIGGTNFGFTSGANYYDVLTPDVTSYDYDALLSECGDITPKYNAFREVIGKFISLPEVTLTTKIIKKDYGTLQVLDRVGLSEALEDLAVPVNDTYPRSMEKLGQNFGYILYRSRLTKEKKLEKLRLFEANDRAKVFVSGKPVITLYDRELLTEHIIDAEVEENDSIDILVENMGRVNFGPRIEKQRKGIDGSVLINDHQHFNWTHYPLPLDNLDRLDFSKGYTEGLPAFYRFEFNVEEAGDTFIDFTGWGKGCIFINGFNLGRFWEIGPQKRLYLPAPLLKPGCNEIIIFETEGKSSTTISLMAVPDLG